jgi:hypothetical protein
MKKFLIVGLLLLVGLAGCADKRAEQAKALEAELKAKLAEAAPAGGAPGLLYDTLTLTPAAQEADGFRGEITGLVLDFGADGKLPLGEASFTLKPEGDDLRHYSDLKLPETIAAKFPGGSDFTLKLAGFGGTATWSNAYATWVDADIALGRVDFAIPSEKVTVGLESAGYKLASKDTGEGRVDQIGSFVASKIAFDSPDASGTAGKIAVDATITGARMAELVKLNAEYRKALVEKNLAALGEVLGKMSRALGGFEVRFAAEDTMQKDPVADESFALANSSFTVGMQGLDGAQSGIRIGFDYGGLAFAEPVDPADDFGMILPTAMRLNLDFAKVPTEKLIELAASSASETGGDSTDALQLAGMMFMMGLQGALAEAGTELHIADSLVKTAEAETNLAGLFVMDPQAVMGATGTIELKVAGFDKLAVRIERLAAPEFADWLRQAAKEEAAADGSKLAVFEVALAPDGSITVNGQPFPQ